LAHPVVDARTDTSWVAKKRLRAVGNYSTVLDSPCVIQSCQATLTFPR